jgi:hypothetical protein
MRPCRASYPDVTVKFQGKIVLPVFLCQREEVCAVRRTRIIHQQVESPMMCDCLRNGLLRLSGFAQVARYDLNLDIRGLPETIRDLLKPVLIAGDKAKMHALSHEFGAIAAPMPRFALVISADLLLKSRSMFRPTYCPQDDAAEVDLPQIGLGPPTRHYRKFIRSTIALLSKHAYIGDSGLQERNICQKMCWASRLRS